MKKCNNRCDYGYNNNNIIIICRSIIITLILSCCYNTVVVAQQHQENNNDNNNNDVISGNIFFNLLGPFFCLFDRCGFFGLGTLIHQDNIQQECFTNECNEECTIFPFLYRGWSCGRCGVITTTSPITTVEPSVSPTTVAPTTQPTEDNTYTITLDMNGIDISDQIFFTNAKERWETIIINDLQDYPSSEFPESPPFSNCTYPNIVDDVYICAYYNTIDGVGRILADAGPIYVRTGDQPITGAIRFDIDDLPDIKSINSKFAAIVVHEMAHVLGFGTRWDNQGVVQDPIFLNCTYIGNNAITEYKAISGCDELPIEQDGIQGSTCLHWDELCFRRELMSTAIDVDSAIFPISRITIASFEDMGYQVNYDAADEYDAFDLNPNCLCSNNRQRRRDNNILNRPHGSTRYLSGSKNDNENKVMSPEAKAYAINFGLELLKQASASHDNIRSSSGSVTFVGDESRLLIVEDQGNIFSVVVSKQSE